MTGTAVDINQTVRALFNASGTGWAAQEPTVPLTFWGDDFEPPQSGNWVRVTILGGTSSQVAQGNPSRQFRRMGIVRVQLFLVAGFGSGSAYVYTDSVKSILEGKTVDGVRFFATSLPQSEGQEGRWARWRVDTNFDSDEFRSV